MFDVQVNLAVTFKSVQQVLVVANAHIELGGEMGRREGYWTLLGRQDARLPHFGPGRHRWDWDPIHPHRIVLIHNHKPWAYLEGFPEITKPDSKGLLFAFRLPIGPSTYHPHGWYVGEWKVISQARHRNLPTVDPNAPWLQRTIDSCSVDTGFRFDTSWGFGGAGGAGVGGGVQPSATIVLKRKEPADARRWHLNYWAIGAGVTTPNISAGGSTKETPSEGLTNVLAGPGQPDPFPVHDFAGNILIVDVGAGASIGKGKFAVGPGWSTALVMFSGVTAADYSFGAYGQIKALVWVKWAAGAGGKGNTKLLGASASATLFAGTVTVRQMSK